MRKGDMKMKYYAVMEVIQMAVYAMNDYEIEILAKSFLPEIQAFFESEEGKAEYEKWLSKQENDNLKKTA